MELVLKYYQGELIDQDNVVSDEADELKPSKKQQEPQMNDSTTLKDEKLKPKKHLKPIL